MTRYVIITAFIMFLGCTKQYHLADVKPRTYRIEKASFPVDVKTAEIIEPYKLQLDVTMNEVISYNESEMVKGKPSSTLTNWFADVLLDETQKLVADSLDFAIQNYGGIRLGSVPKGNITVGKVYELMPFDNIMYITEMDGNTVQMLFDKMAESGGWPVSKNVYFEIAFGKAKNILIKKKTLDPTHIYKVAIPDYIANGGDNMTFMKGLKAHNTNALIRDMIIQHLKTMKQQNKTIIPDNEKRIIE
jgi:2',3'-cyclic-nucleotide 2'-phosphodiesterase (5'-nucleotidase family)